MSQETFRFESSVIKELVGLERFELSTPRLSSECSNQLSYRPIRLERPGIYLPLAARVNGGF